MSETVSPINQLTQPNPASGPEKRSGLNLWRLFVPPGLLVLATGFLPFVMDGFFISLLCVFGLLGSLIWLLLAVRTHLQRPKVKWLTSGLITLQCAALYGFFLANQHYNLAYAVIGTWVLSFGFSLILAFIRYLLSFPLPIFAVAKLTLREALRLRIAMILLILSLALIPLLPGLLSEDASPANRLRSFLHTSLYSLEFFLIFLSLVISCGVIHRDIFHRQIHLSLTKPVSRLTYLVGRWFGTVIMCSVLILLTGSAILMHLSLSLQGGDLSHMDAVTIRNEILTSRQMLRPSLPEDKEFERLRRERLNTLQKVNPVVWGDPGDAIPVGLYRSLENEIIQAWFQMNPVTPRTYTFKNLKYAGDKSDYVTLRYKPKIDKGGAEGFLVMRFKVQGQHFPIEYGETSRGTIIPRAKSFTVMNKETAQLEIPSRMIDEEGNLQVEFTFMLPPQVMLNQVKSSSVTFSPEDGITLYYPDGYYQINYLKAFGVLWIKILFYAALGVMITSRLSFQTAIMAGLIVFIISENSQFLITANEEFLKVGNDKIGKAPPGRSQAWFYLQAAAQGLTSGQNLLRNSVASLGFSVLLIAPSGDFSPWSALREGRSVPLNMFISAFLRMGLFGTVILLTLGLLMFRKREIATAQK